MSISISITDSCARSIGLPSMVGGYDIAIPYANEDLKSDASGLCKTLVQHCMDSKRPILPTEKVAWATGMLEFRQEHELVSAGALNIALDKFEKTADLVLQSWRAQEEVCRAAESRLLSPLLDDFVVVTPDIVKQGALANSGIRFPFLKPNSGWWLYSAEFSGPVSQMRRVHIGDVLKHDLELTRFLGLQPGKSFTRKPFAVYDDEEARRREPL